MSEYQTIIYEETDGVAWVPPNRPEAHNAFNDQMQREFEKFFEYLKTQANEFSRQSDAFSSSEALIPISRLRVTRVHAEQATEE